MPDPDLRPDARPSRRPRVLLGAFACHPDRGSEPTVGWNRAVEAARVAEVDVITHVEGDNVAAGGAAVERDGLDVRFHFLALSAAERALMRVPGAYYLGYRLWNRRAYRLAARLHAARPFDVVHQVNLCGYREPGELWRLGAPFVWGPVGGTQNTPAAYLRYGGLGMTVREGVRSALNRVQLRTSRRVRRAAEAASVVLAANSTGRRDLAAALGVEARQLLETGVRAVGAPKRWAERAPGPFRVLWAGEVVQRKGIRLALDALAVLRQERGLDVELVVVGDGPARGLVADAEGVTWTGWIPRPDLLRLYAEADALAFTSLRDTSGNVMLEALAAGLPLAYLDHQGAADMGTPGCGLAVPVTTPAESVRALADALGALATDPDLYDRLSRGAVARARELAWTANGDAVNAIYAQLAGVPVAPASVAPSAEPEPAFA